MIGDILGSAVSGALRGAVTGVVRGVGASFYPPCFQCREKCISYSYRCDGEVDCYGAEDEAACDYICPYETHHRCSDTGLCIDNHDLCDGHYDCVNGEDESNCGRPWMGKHGPIPIFTGKTNLFNNEATESKEWNSLGFRSNIKDAQNHSMKDMEDNLNHPFNYTLGV